MEVTIIFPHQLFKNHPALKKGREVYLIEESLFFNQFPFHLQKLLFHRASMSFYYDSLKSLGFKVNYISSKNSLADAASLINELGQKGIKEIHYCDVCDDWLNQKINSKSKLNNIKCVEYESPMFLLNSSELSEYFNDKKKFFHNNFYIKQRRKFSLLVNKNGEPEGEKWSFDDDNRKKYPKKLTPPKVVFEQNEFYKKSIESVKKDYPNNYGEINLSIQYPCTFESTKKWLDNFFEERFKDFGTYEDAIVKDEYFLNHSVLTPMLNVGLITPKEIIDYTMNYCESNAIPINSLEGFIRQIIGWREFIRGIYVHAGRKERMLNFWNFNRSIPKSFYNGTTGILPIDETIKKVLKTGYCHHIERLMVLGNFMLLCEFNPNEVYQWFMELFIDAYDWVMVPNVYGMSQFADGGMMATKPYISGSNYIMKMSDYPKGDWQKTWDGLFWRFMDSHRNFFLSNPRLSMMVRMYDKMDEDKKSTHHQNANAFLNSL